MIPINGKTFRKAVRDKKLGEGDDERLYQGPVAPLTNESLDRFVEAIKALLSEPYTSARAEDVQATTSEYLRVFVISEKELPQEDFSDEAPVIELSEQLHSFVNKQTGNVFLPMFDESGPILAYGARCNVADESSYKHALTKKGMMLPFIGGARILLSLGVDVDSANELGETMLMYACSQLSEPLVTWLLDNGADPNKAMPGPLVTALHRLAEAKGSDEQKSELVEKLVQKGAKVNAGTAWNITPLHLAALQCHVLTCEKLIKLGAEIRSEVSSGEKPIDLIPKSTNGLDAGRDKAIVTLTSLLTV